MVPSPTSGEASQDLTQVHLDVYDRGHGEGLWNPQHGDVDVPDGWDYLPAGDHFVTRQVKAAGVFWTAWRPRGRNRDHRRKLGLYAPETTIAAARERARETEERRAKRARHQPGFTREDGGALPDGTGRRGADMAGLRAAARSTRRRDRCRCVRARGCRRQRPRRADPAAQPGRTSGVGCQGVHPAPLHRLRGATRSVRTPGRRRAPGDQGRCSVERRRVPRRPPSAVDHLGVDDVRVVRHWRRRVRLEVDALAGAALHGVDRRLLVAARHGDARLSGVGDDLGTRRARTRCRRRAR